MSFQIYTPYVCNIIAITSEGAFTLVTTEIDHGFVVGNLVRFQIPPQYGMRELNPLHAYVINAPMPNQVLLSIQTLEFTPFVLPMSAPPVVLDPAQIIPAGDANSGTSAPGGVLESLTIPGAYQQIIF